MLLLLASSTQKMYVRGKREKHAVCEQCDHEYVYEIERDAIGQDKSFFSWDEKAAFRKAEADGWEKLDKILDDEDDAVNCPNCGWVQESMIAAVRKQSYHTLKKFASIGFFLAAVGLALAVIAPLATYAASQKDPQLWDRSIATSIVGVLLMQLGLTPGCFFWALRKFLCWRYDPNSQYQFHR